MTELFKPKYIDGRKLWKKFDEAGLFVDHYDRDIAQGAVEDMMEEAGSEKERSAIRQCIQKIENA